MKRVWLVCCVHLSYFITRLQSRTVLPIVYFTTTAIPNGYYGLTAAEGNGYRGRNYEDDDGIGYSPSEPDSSYRYGHRTVSPSSIKKVHNDRDEQKYALYESPHTYEYMKNPRKSERNRMPETERVPPGDDVEFINDDREQRHTNYYGQNDNKKKKSKTTRSDRQRYVDEPEIGSSSANLQRDEKRTKTKRTKNTRVPQKKKNGAAGVIKVSKKDERIDDKDELSDNTQHKIHKKNEYSKKQQFFDEEHVNLGNKKPDKKTALNRNRKKSKPKNRIRQTNRKRRMKKDKNKNQDNNYRQMKPRSIGYGQILAVRR